MELAENLNFINASGQVTSMICNCNYNRRCKKKHTAQILCIGGTEV